MGIEAEAIGVAADTEEALRTALKNVGDCDLLITIGGVSAGDYDLVPKVLKEMAAELVFHKVAIKPGKPLLYAIHREGRTTCSPLQIFGLPGNPVSALMVFDRFVRPALLKMMGASKVHRPAHEAVAAEPLKGASGKEVYLRGVVTSEHGRFVARSAGAQGSAMLRSLARANAVLIVPAQKPRIAAGESLTFEFLEGEP
jgi:molybdopterin molybdotransferase